MKSLHQTEKKLHDLFLHLIIGGVFLVDSKEEIYEFIKKYLTQIHDHILEQYRKYRDLYIDFKTRRKEKKKKQS